MSRGETFRITLSMAVACALGAGVLGALYMVTDRYQRAAAITQERRAIAELLGLDRTTQLTEIREFLAPDRREVVYRVGESDATRDLVFTLEGTLTADSARVAGEKLQPLERMFVARRAGRLVGFVVESTTRGYKNRIRFMVGIAPDFTIAGVRVLEHEEDPGLGAEVATPEFQGQFIGRSAAGLDVTRDPMPEDWRVALAELRRMPPTTWRERHIDLLGRERLRPVYAVTGATISSRALTEGVREALDHFRRRWTLIAPHLGGAS
jgi:electron transport complex protein RnfG